MRKKCVITGTLFLSDYLQEENSGKEEMSKATIVATVR